MKNKKTMKKVGALCLAIGLLAATGIGAYLTSTDVKTDTYTIGSVEIENTFVAQNPENIVANAEFAYDAAGIENVGISDAYVFMTVDVPVVTTGTHLADGTPVADAAQELFAFEALEGWTQIGDKLDVTKDGEVVAQRYVFAYGAADAMTVLSAGETTTDLFKFVTAINFDNDLASTAGYEVELNAYGIQTTGLNVNSAEGIWNIVRNAFSISESK